MLIDWMWSDLEPKEGQFDWKDLDTVVAYWKARNKQLVVRLWVTTDPGWAGTPEIRPVLIGSGMAASNITVTRVKAASEQRCPAYADPTWETNYLPKLKRFLTAYRDRYHTSGNPIILDHAMGFGDWGEWHTMWSHYRWPSREKRREVLGKAIGAVPRCLCLRSGRRRAGPAPGHCPRLRRRLRRRYAAGSSNAPTGTGYRLGALNVIRKS